MSSVLPQRENEPAAGDADAETPPASAVPPPRIGNRLPLSSKARGKRKKLHLVATSSVSFAPKKARLAQTPAFCDDVLVPRDVARKFFQCFELAFSWDVYDHTSQKLYSVSDVYLLLDRHARAVQTLVDVAHLLGVHAPRRERFAHFRSRHEVDDECTLLYEATCLLCNDLPTHGVDISTPRAEILRAHFASTTSAVKTWLRESHCRETANGVGVNDEFGRLMQETLDEPVHTLREFAQTSGMLARASATSRREVQRVVRFCVYLCNVEALNDTERDEFLQCVTRLVNFQAHNEAWCDEDFLSMSTLRQFWMTTNRASVQLSVSFVRKMYALCICAERVSTRLVVAQRAGYECMLRVTRKLVRYSRRVRLGPPSSALGAELKSADYKQIAQEACEMLSMCATEMSRAGEVGDGDGDGDDQPRFYAPRGDYILLPNLNVGKYALYHAAKQVDFDREYLFVACTESEADLRLFYTHLAKLRCDAGSAFGRLAGVEGTRTLKGDKRRSFYVAYDGYHGVDNVGKNTFSTLGDWLQLVSPVAHFNARLVHWELETSRAGHTGLNRLLDEAPSSSSSSLFSRRRFVTPSLARECVRQLVMICAALEMLPERYVRILRTIDVEDFIVDRFNRVLLIVGNDAHREHAKRAWRFEGAPEPRASSSAVVARLLRGAAAVCAEALYGGAGGFELRNADKFDARLVPVRTRFNTVTSVHAVRFMREAFNYEMSAAALASHAYFAQGAAQGDETLAPLQFTLQPSRSTFNTHVLHAASFFGKPLIAYTGNEDGGGGDDGKNSCVARYGVGNGQAAERFAVLVRMFGSCQAGTLARMKSSRSHIRLDVVTPGAWPRGVNFRTGAINGATVANGVYPAVRHDDYYLDWNRASASRAPSDYDTFTKEGASVDCIACHSCMGACRVSVVFQRMLNELDTEKRARAAAAAATAAAAAEILETAELVQRYEIDARTVHSVGLSLAQCCIGSDFAASLAAGPSAATASSAFYRLIDFTSEILDCPSELSTRVVQQVARAAFTGNPVSLETSGTAQPLASFRRTLLALRPFYPHLFFWDAGRGEGGGGWVALASASAEEVAPGGGGDNNSAVSDDGVLSMPSSPLSSSSPRDAPNVAPIESFQSFFGHLSQVVESSNGDASNVRLFRVNQDSSNASARTQLAAAAAAAAEHFTESVPECIVRCRREGGDDAVRAHMDPVFFISSLFRSSQVARMLKLDTFAARPLELFNSAQEGVGGGVATSIWSDFFESLREHRVFTHNGNFVYTLVDLRDEWLAYEEAEADDASLARKDIVCARCSQFARTLGGGEVNLACQLLSRRFFRTLGQVLRYCVVNEIHMPMRLDAPLLQMLMEPDALGAIVRTGATHSASACADTVRVARPAETNALLNVRRNELASLDVEFDRTELTARSEMGYLHKDSNAGSAFSIDQLSLWGSCATSFDWLPVSTLIHSACGRGTATAVLAFAEILHGASDDDGGGGRACSAAELYTCSALVLECHQERQVFYSEPFAAALNDRSTDAMASVDLVRCVHHTMWSAQCQDFECEYCVREKRLGTVRREFEAHFEFLGAVMMTTMNTTSAQSRLARAQFDATALSFLEPRSAQLPVAVCAACEPSESSASGDSPTMQRIVQTIRSIDALAARACRKKELRAAFDAEKAKALRDELFGADARCDSELVRCALLLSRYYTRSVALPALLLAARHEQEKKQASARDLYTLGVVRDRLKTLYVFHKAMDRFLEIARGIFTMLQYNTQAYWRRWLLHDSDATSRAAFLYAATGSRSISAHAKRAVNLHSTYAATRYADADAPRFTVGEALLDVARTIEQRCGTEVQLRAQRADFLEHWGVSFGSLVVALLCPSVSVEHMRHPLHEPRVPSMKEFQEAEPASRIAVTVRVKREPSFSGAYSLLSDGDFMRRNRYICGELGNLGRCPGWLNMVRRWTLSASFLGVFERCTLNRIPEYGTCDKHARFYLYESYDTFKARLETSLEACRSGFHLI